MFIAMLTKVAEIKDDVGGKEYSVVRLIHFVLLWGELLFLLTLA